MAFTKEYAAKLIFTLDDVRKAERAQRNIYDYGFDQPDEGTLVNKLAAVSGVLSTVFFLSTPASLAAGVFSILGGMMAVEKDILKTMVHEGYWQLGYLEDFLDDNPSYDRLEVNLPFIEYETQGVRFITGKGVVTRVHPRNGGGWIIL
ncbi:hypothetical protein [Cohnella sp.]|uniref:hypothetical protein n=1 Tax=Cohnella sp. TaxID=1883426 RepID=UPI003704C91C